MAITIQMTARCDGCQNIIKRAETNTAAEVDSVRYEWRRAFQRPRLEPGDMRKVAREIYCDRCAAPEGGPTPGRRLYEVLEKELNGLKPAGERRPWSDLAGGEHATYERIAAEVRA